MTSTIALSDRARILLDRAASPPERVRVEPMSTPIRQAVEAALDRGETHYTDRPGLGPLREKIAALLSERFSIAPLGKNDVIVTCGVTEARFVAIQQLMRRGEVLAAPGAGELLFGSALLRGAELASTVPADARMVYLRSSSSPASLRSALALAPAAALILFEVDEPVSRFHPGQVQGFAERTLTVGALGEESWRIGYLASPGQSSAHLQDFKQALTICSTNLSQWASLAALEAQ